MLSPTNTAAQVDPVPFLTLASNAQSGPPDATCSLLELQETVSGSSVTPEHLCFWVQLDGKTTVFPSSGARAYPLNDVNVFATPPGATWNGAWRGKSRMVLLEVSPKLYSEIGGHHIDFPNRGRLAILDDGQLKSGISTAYRDLMAGSPAGPVFAEYLARGITAHYLRTHCRVRNHRGGGPRRFSNAEMRCIHEYVEANLASKLTLEQLAANLDMGVTHFCRLFRRSTGLSPHQYLLQKRVEYAKEKLRGGAVNLSEVALSLGFYDQSQFTNTFKRWVGLTPQAFRRTWQAN